jgi:nucleotide-binding universal stress UspA family protein
MNKTILMAVDGSERCCAATATVGELFKNSPDHGLLLLHCVPQTGGLYPGEITSPIFETGGVEASLSGQRRAGREVLDRSARALLDIGFPADRVDLELKLNSVDPARDILEEAEAQKVHAIALGRRGLNKVETILLGSVSSRVAQQSGNRAVWIVDGPVFPTGGVLVAVEGVPECHALTQYASDSFAELPAMRFTFLNFITPRPPSFWDDGHILSDAEKAERRAQVEKWRSERVQEVRDFMDEGREFLLHKGVPADSIHTRIEEASEGVARDLLNDIAQKQYQIVMIGKKSFKKKAPFLIGSHANKLLHNVRQTILCLVG